MPHRTGNVDTRNLPGSNFFERLLLLPLFGGIGRADFWEIVERIPIGFHRAKNRAKLVEAGTLCDSLLFVMKGSVCATRTGDGNRYKLYEWLAAPIVIQPECLFGLTTTYTRTFLADEELQYFVIAKSDIRDVLFEYPTFRINYLNMLSRQCQQYGRYLWHTPGDSLHERFVFYVQQRCIHPAGHKQLEVRIDDLAETMMTSRARVSQMLHDFEQRKLITTLRGRIDIPKLEEMIAAASEYR